VRGNVDFNEAGRIVSPEELPRQDRQGRDPHHPVAGPSPDRCPRSWTLPPLSSGSVTCSVSSRTGWFLGSPPTGTRGDLSSHPYSDITPKPALYFLSAQWTRPPDLEDDPHDRITAESSMTDDQYLLVPSYYAEHGYPHDAWARLRRDDPVHRVEDWDGPPYWALTRCAEIIHVSKAPGIFENAPRMNMEPGGVDPGKAIRSLLVMDPPEHQKLRALTSKRFTPGAMRQILGGVDEITSQVLDLASTGGEIRETDFVESIAARIPIWVIAEMLGVSPDDWEQLYDWTNEAVGASDPEFQAGRSEEETRATAIMAMAGYFKELSEQRKRDPRDDLISLLVHAEVDGQPLSELDLMSYYITLLSAGNETTRNAISGGLLQLIEHPDQLARLRREPELLDGFIEETLRFVSPVIHMCRTPNRDVELDGKKIAAGEPLVLFYPSANRDETVFDQPNRFDIGRSPNPHLAFGIGEHFCLGTHVARLELRAVFRHLIARLQHVELVEPPTRLAHAIVGGIKHLRVRYAIADRKFKAGFGATSESG